MKRPTPREGETGLRLEWPGRDDTLDEPPLVTPSLVEVSGPEAGRGKLIRGDNRAAMRALEAELAGAVDLVYIDPPFGTGQSFSLTRRGGGDAAEVFAYADQLSLDAYLSTMLDQLRRIRALLSERGTVFVHCDWHVSHYLRCLLDEVFGADCFKNEIVWRYRRWPAKTRVFQRMHDVIFWYGKTPGDLHTFHPLYEPLAASTLATWGTKRQVADFSSGRRKPSQTDEETRGAPMSDVWDIGIIAPIAKERVGYPTQKPEALLRRIVEVASSPGDLVADLFCGSGTTLAVAARLGRRFVGCDVSPAAIHATRKRLLAQDAPFALYDLGTPTNEAPPPAVEVVVERADLIGGVRVSLTGDAASLDAWAIDWEHEGSVFRTAWHARREGRDRHLALVAEHAYPTLAPRRIAVQLAGAHGEAELREIAWTFT
jgi:DNA modification methylase